MTQEQKITSSEILPPLPTNADVDRPETVVLSTDLPPELEFEPIPHTPKSGQKFTPDVQRMFINALAACGSVRTSARAVSISTGQIYHLRNRPGSEGFAAAWDKAVERGARRVLDVLVDHGINGTPEYIYKDGELVAERRHFNTRSMMWVVAHYMPERFGVQGGLMHHGGTASSLTRLKTEWRKEWEDEWRTQEAGKSRDSIATFHNRLRNIRSGFKRNIASDPAKRAAWELLTGPTDWSDFDKPAVYAGLPHDFNMNRPDVIVPLAEGEE